MPETLTVDFAAPWKFEWETLVDVGDREDYGELREIALEFIGVRLHVMVFARRGDRIRVISLRQAEKTKVRDYVKATEG